MKEIIKITVALTISCLAAGLVMGSVFIVTAKAKKHNEHMNFEQTMLGLLGYDHATPPPEDLYLDTLYRYILADEQGSALGYVVPVRQAQQRGYALLVHDLKGRYVKQVALEISAETLGEEKDRLKAIQAILDPGTQAIYADSAIVAGRGTQRTAYLLPGEFPGFKTSIKAMLALDADFNVLGVEIMEHEEDPGLGAEIEQEYFKNQFKGKSFDIVKGLKVVKEPLPDEYRTVLETRRRQKAGMTAEQIEAIKSRYRDKDIYALTGATISSDAVNSGVKNIVKKFAYRLQILDRVIAEENLAATF